ncbi:hypothetical protein SERLADRAFT_355454 [Serpula lacrymans var. lacrymans S7.9]|uniref:Zn(2)-C6 fungal-type domain-containing protein n=1 Tax=Serpula lacrymans var. lacrymans (strain S7.9) TaxID=578457 RepID=F8NRU0_SERL9|nr:uncharacterized protein SERLADRAFT_355454 [Serpula lacrymans var. lacrymans S7.9]EGO26826.1 hypothetical protein SERLADRAFT_355454 [Serpula lacrymans var. lacrymans S7.9]
MPQASRSNARHESKDAQKAIEKEQKRSRGAMSCAECRRLKLKCDKTVPCSSCKRRGCSAICPNGVLITGQGTRFVLADTEKLHQKIAQMSDRIRQLEDALTIMQSSTTNEPHPLLHRELLGIKSIIDLHAAVDEIQASRESQEADVNSQYIDAFGTLAIRDDGAATFYGPSAGSENSDSNQVPGRRTIPSQRFSPKQELPTNVKRLTTAFPLSPTVGTDTTVDLLYLIEHHLPAWPHAHRLCKLYLEQAPWFFGAVTKRELVEETLPLWYTEASDLIPLGSVAPQQRSADSVDDNSSENLAKGPHELALMFMILCFGALTDIDLPAAPDNSEADMYFQLTRAALNLEPILERPPSIATVQTLSLMAIYQGICSGEHSIESTWATFGLATKLAQSVNRDCARWKLSPAEVQKRRALFWELFITDCWQSLATGRLASFSLPYVDCELPSDPDEKLDEHGAIIPSFPSWKARFGYECVSAVVKNTLTAKVPKYSVIVELDRKIRDMALPKYAQGVPPTGAGLADTMSHFMPINYRHLTLLYVHRCFFAEAVSSSPTDPMKSQYAPSFLAGYRSASEILTSLRTAFSMFPRQIARFWVLWTHAFSSAVMLASVVTHAIGSGAKSKITSAALLELRMAVDLFEMASVHGGRAVKFLPILQRLLQKAQEINSNAQPPVVRNDMFSPTPSDDNKDELYIFSGQTHTVATKVHPPTVSSRSSQYSPSQTSSKASTPSASSQQNYVNLHPTLVDQWNGFEGHLNTQIYNAQQVFYNDSHQVYHDHAPVADHRQHALVPPVSQAVPETYYNQHSYDQEHSYPQHQTSYETSPPAHSSHSQYSGVPAVSVQPANDQYWSPPQHKHQDQQYQNQQYQDQNQQYQTQQYQGQEYQGHQYQDQRYQDHQYQDHQYHGHGHPQQPHDHVQYQTYNNYGHQPQPQQQQQQSQLYPAPQGPVYGGLPPDHQSLQETWQSFMYTVNSPRPT